MRERKSEPRKRQVEKDRAVSYLTGHTVDKKTTVKPSSNKSKRQEEAIAETKALS